MEKKNNIKKLKTSTEKTSGVRSRHLVPNDFDLTRGRTHTAAHAIFVRWAKEIPSRLISYVRVSLRPSLVKVCRCSKFLSKIKYFCFSRWVGVKMRMERVLENVFTHHLRSNFIAKPLRTRHTYFRDWNRKIVKCRFLRRVSKAC